ncbi:MAG: DUF4910 domain-containing protein [Bacteroidota bacterium]
MLPDLHLHNLAARLYPLRRSLTGDGVRATLAVLAERLPSLEQHEVPTGTPVLDWTVPDEWNWKAAWVADAEGRRVVDATEHGLHLVGYSVPVRQRMTWAELKPHLHTLPDQSDAIPYRTAYYAQTWGFCLRHRTVLDLDARGDEAEYEVVIDATRGPGALTYGEVVLPGETEETVLISAHVCHPMLANDNLSGLVVAAALAEQLAARAQRCYTYRFVWAPGTVGAITWLARNEAVVPTIRHGLILANLGDAGGFTYKQSRLGTFGQTPAEIDRAVAVALRDAGEALDVRPFIPYGYDERQYGSPGFNLPVGCLTRTPYGEYPEYHTSADDLDFISEAQLQGALARLTDVIDILEANRRLINLHPYGEPQLGRRRLYRALGGLPDAPLQQQAMLWVLNLSATPGAPEDGFDLLAVAERSGLPFRTLAAAADLLERHDLVA